MSELQSRIPIQKQCFSLSLGLFVVLAFGSTSVAQDLPPRTLAQDDTLPAQVDESPDQAEPGAGSDESDPVVAADHDPDDPVAEVVDSALETVVVEEAQHELETSQAAERIVRGAVASSTLATRASVENARMHEEREAYVAFLAHASELLTTVRSDSKESLARLIRNRTAESGEGYFVLRPYVEDPRWMEAMRLLESDDCRESLKVVEDLFGGSENIERADPGVRYAHARIQMCAGQAAVGRATLQELTALESPVGHLARVRLGQKAESDPEHREGMYLSQKLRAAQKLAKTDVDAAIAQLDILHEDMTSNWDRYRVRLAQAEIYESSGRIDEAGEAYLALYRKTRGWKANSTVEDRIERLERRHKKKFLTYGERIDRMRHLVARGRYSQARKVSVENAKIRGVKGNEIRGWARYRQALQYEREKKRSKAVELFESANELIRDSEVRPRLYFGWARALRRLDRDREAIALYGKLCEEFSEHHLCDDATYEAGRLLQFLEDHEEAQERFSFVIDGPESDFVPDALWRSAFSHYLTGQWDDAIARLETLRQKYPDETDRSELSLGLKATYWIGASHLKAGRMGAARHAFQETIDRGMLTWYGRLAEARMNENGWRARVEVPTLRLTQNDLEDLSQLRVNEHPRLAVAAEFVRLGLWEDALAELKEQRGLHPVPDGTHEMLAAVHLARGDANWSHWIMKKHIAESGPTAETMRDWGTAFPLNYMEYSHKFGSTYNVSPFLVQAIIRQESGFRETVKSWAGAVGLMQLMPRTAKWTSNTFLQKGRFSTRQLLDPETNIRLGSMYIRVHTAHASDSIPLALAGYNAGAGALKSWFKRYGDRELDAFVESITYQEARGYVRKVFTSYTAYSALYSGELPDLTLKLPEQLRSWGKIPEVEEPIVRFVEDTEHELTASRF